MFRGINTKEKNENQRKMTKVATGEFLEFILVGCVTLNTSLTKVSLFFSLSLSSLPPFLLLYYRNVPEIISLVNLCEDKCFFHFLY
jgi:hypothetical protein